MCACWLSVAPFFQRTKLASSLLVQYNANRSLILIMFYKKKSLCRSSLSPSFILPVNLLRLSKSHFDFCNTVFTQDYDFYCRQTKLHNLGATVVGVDKFGNKYYEKLGDTQYGGQFFSLFIIVTLYWQNFYPFSISLAKFEFKVAVLQYHN